MRKLFALAAILFALATSVLANDVIKGSMTWVSGTLAAPLTVTAAPQTVSLQVGSSVKTYPNTYIAILAGTNLELGYPIELLAANSNPFAATFTTLSVTLRDPFDYRPQSMMRTVPINSSGALQANVAVTNSDSNGFLMELYYPDFAIGSYSFPNGMDAVIGSPITSYSLSIPTDSNVTTLSHVNFPIRSGKRPASLYEFSFEASGLGSIMFDGFGLSSSLTLAGSVSTVGKTFSYAEIYFSS